MLSCDHFIYTSAKTEKRQGYQIVAQSAGINDEIISDLAGYMYPIGLDPEEFQESRSLIILNKNKIAYSIIKNIGIGYDARKGTLYNHTFVVEKEEFGKIKNDSRIFDKHFMIQPEIRGNLAKIAIEYAELPIKFESIRKIGFMTLENILRFLFLNRKVALTDTTDMNRIQNILAVLPPSLRLIPFSTMVNQPDKQTEYNFIQIKKNLIFRLSPNWKIVNISKGIVINKQINRSTKVTEFGHLTNLILNQNEESLKKLYNMFEQLPGVENTNKIKFSIHKSLLESTNDYARKAEQAYECAIEAQKFDLHLTSEYLNKAKKYSAEVDNKELIAKIKFGEVTLLLERAPLSIKIMDEVIDKLDTTNQEVINILLNQIVKKKRDEFIKKGYPFLKSAITSHSKYTNEIMRLYAENKKLESFLIKLIRDKDLQSYSILDSITDIMLSYNPNLLKILFLSEADLNKKKDFKHLRKLVSSVFANPNLRDKANPELILQITGILKDRLEKVLDNMITKNSSGKLKWNSEYDFEDFKHLSHDIFDPVRDVLKHIIDYGDRKMNAELKKEVIYEIEMIDGILKKIHSVEYKKSLPAYELPIWYEMLLRFWGLK
jgi:hypothetical protein